MSSQCFWCVGSMGTKGELRGNEGRERERERGKEGMKAEHV